ncbi:hypothetical protein M501DRAFT_1017468 [Patellaria atrata CBS 101060]|uniref:Uncharacterized protein n=1 Tax=Patellaria atrata CBS 101060 TaxID=1346257 RepID=A0A9P4S9E6_9PEZI|nr:hypothetical protein M501DRAFT_1017468 [Patellaria atrata CBS 101060]
MERRDKAIDKRERNRQKAKNVGSDLRKMKLELSDLIERETPELSKKLKPKPSKRVNVTGIYMNIYLVSGENYLKNVKHRLSEDENPLDEDEDAHRAIIYEKLPKEYHHLAHVFSKSISDKLPPLREGVDHDIVLD